MVRILSLLLCSLLTVVFESNQVRGLSLSSSSSEKASTNNNDEMSRRTWLQKTTTAAVATAATVAPPSSVVAALSSFPGSASGAAAATVTTSTASGPGPHLMKEAFGQGVTDASAGRFYFPTLVPPLFQRATYRYTLGRNAWALEQLLNFQNVTATIRTTVLLLDSGGLWVHSPQWPTGEYCQLLNDIGHPVKHVVLPCNALEHKAPMKAFLSKYPDATVWISPGQYGPFGECGFDLNDCSMGYRVDGIFPLDFAASKGTASAPLPPWANEFDMRTLYADLPENAGPVSEVAFVHKPTRTLVATDAVIFVPSQGPPPIFGTFFDDEKMQSDPNFWPKSVLQSVFLPLRPDASGQYPGYLALENKLVRAPILRAFGDARAPQNIRNWSRSVEQLDFDRILTSHFASPIAATPKDFAECFSYLDNNQGGKKMVNEKLPNIACQDWELLDGLNKVIEDNKLGAPVVFDFKQGCSD